MLGPTEVVPNTTLKLIPVYTYSERRSCTLEAYFSLPANVSVVKCHMLSLSVTGGSMACGRPANREKLRCDSCRTELQRTLCRQDSLSDKYCFSSQIFPSPVSAKLVNVRRNCTCETMSRQAFVKNLQYLSISLFYTQTHKHAHARTHTYMLI